MHGEYTWREKRCHVHSQQRAPCFVNTGMTTLPCGNAHYSMYGIREKDYRHYQSLLTRALRIYPHYSSELIVDVESAAGAGAIAERCISMGWGFERFHTGSAKGGAHFAIPRDAEPGELLYMRDKLLVWDAFQGIPDIDCGIYRPMHLIRGIGRVHEKTGGRKHLVETVAGTCRPTVIGSDISALLMEEHERRKNCIVPTVTSDWSRAQRMLMRHDPGGVKKGGRYVALFCLAKDCFKAGFNYRAVEGIVETYNLQLEEPQDAAEIERAISGAERSVNGSAFRG